MQQLAIPSLCARSPSFGQPSRVEALALDPLLFSLLLLLLSARSPHARPPPRTPVPRRLHPNFCLFLTTSLCFLIHNHFDITTTIPRTRSLQVGFVPSFLSPDLFWALQWRLASSPEPVYPSCCSPPAPTSRRAAHV